MFALVFGEEAMLLDLLPVDLGVGIEGNELTYHDELSYLFYHGSLVKKAGHVI